MNVLFLGILSLALFWVKGFGLVLAVAAVLLGTIAIVKCSTKPEKFKGRWLAIIGLVLALIAIGTMVYTSEPFQKYCTIDNMEYLFGEPYQQDVVCNTPYILVGTDCCLDENSNNICDTDEVIVITEEPVVEEVTEEEIVEEEPIETEEVIADEPVEIVVEEEPEEEVIPDDLILVVEETNQEETDELTSMLETQIAYLDDVDFSYLTAKLSTSTLSLDVGETGVAVARLKNEYTNDYEKEVYYKVRVTSTRAASWMKESDFESVKTMTFGPYTLITEEYQDIVIYFIPEDYDNMGSRSSGNTYDYIFDFSYSFYEDYGYKSHGDTKTLSLTVN